MWLKEYLNFGKDRPLWAYIVDDLLTAPDYVPNNTIPQERDLRVSPFLQTCKNLEREVQNKRKMPSFVRALLKTAKEQGVRLEGLAFSREILRKMPMWYHTYADRRQMNTLASKSKATECLKDGHKLRTVGDFEEMAAHRSEPEHRQRRRACACETCERYRNEDKCDFPDACFERAEQFLNTLPGKWDPRGEHPEDYEPQRDTRRRRREQTHFDRAVTTRGELANAFRIFTEGTTCNRRLDMTMDDDGGEPEIVATDGSCINNGWANAQAGAGAFFGENDPRNQSVRLPKTVEQSNQAGEAIGTLLATQKANARRLL
ncbi:hypothetical protein GGF50DRAFT_35622, partial [Schizophyllum commune]